MQLTFSPGIPSRRCGRMAVLCFAVATILVTAWSGLSAVAFAQSALPETDGQGRMSAPIGHRQPRAQDLPPDVLRDEGMTRRPPEPTPTTLPNASHDQGDRSAHLTPFDDENLRICRQC
jgi:hypothetical protein